MVKKRQRSEGEAVYPDVAEQRDLIVLLERLNFTEIEAKAYLALFSKSPATAYQIAQLTGLPRPNVYNAVGGLIAKGALQQVSENPVRYIPREPRDFFDTVSRSTSDLCENVITGLQELKIHDQTEFVSNYNGQAAVEVQVRRLIDAARARVYIKSASRLLAPFEDSLFKAANRGVFIYIVAADPGILELPQHERIVVIPHEGTGVATGKAVHHLLTITADAEGALIVAFNGYPAASFTRNDAIVYTVHTMILHEIYLAKIHEAFGSELESRFGTNLAELRRVYRPENLETQVLARGLHKE